VEKIRSHPSDLHVSESESYISRQFGGSTLWQKQVLKLPGRKSPEVPNSGVNLDRSCLGMRVFILAIIR
jgi:hypothetical protein